MAKKKAGRPSVTAVVPVSKVDHLFVELVNHFGKNQSETGSALGCSQSHVWTYLSKTNKTTLSPIVALRAEVATKGKFKCEDLCPELGELIGAINKIRLCAGTLPIGVN